LRYFNCHTLIFALARLSCFIFSTGDFSATVSNVIWARVSIKVSVEKYTGKNGLKQIALDIITY